MNHVNSMENRKNEGEKVIVGRRPKTKDHQFSISSLVPQKFNEVNGIKRVCANPLDRLSELLLDWEFEKSFLSEIDRGNSRNKSSIASAANLLESPSAWTRPEFVKLPLTFQSFQEYISLWEPLMIEEMRENILSNYKTKSANEISKGCFQFQSSKVLPSTTLTVEAVAVNLGSSGSSLENLPSSMDLLLMSPKIIGNAFRHNTPPPSSPVVLGLVIGTAINNGVKTYQIRVRSKFWSKFLQFGEAMEGKSSDLKFRMYYIVIENIRSSWREYQAIHELGVNIPLLPEILGTSNPIDSTLIPDYNTNEQVEKLIEDEKKSLLESDQIQLKVNEKKLLQQKHLPNDFIQYLKNKFNDSQYYAIQMAASQQGFTLVQGPPGTGKTSTIIGILNTVHLREFNRYYQELLQVFTNPQKLQRYQYQLMAIQGNHIPPDQFLIHILQQFTRTKPRILVVAPSNIAVDNIITRILKDGFLDGSRATYRPEMVRVGAGRTSGVESVSLETLVEQACFSHHTYKEKQQLSEQYTKEINQIIQEIIPIQSMLITLVKAFNTCKPLPEGWEVRVSMEHHHPYWVDHNNKTTSQEPPLALAQRMSQPQSPSWAGLDNPIPRPGYISHEELPEYQIASHRFIQLLSSLENLTLKKNRLMMILNHQSLRGGKDMISTTIRDSLEVSLIEGAQLLFTTLNSCGHPSMEAAEFCVTVIDEAAQSTEPSTLIALRRGCQQCIMVGDQRQLPATIFSEVVMHYHYHRSLFERLIESGHPYVMLETQYRMTPEIAEFPSKYFYYSKLLNGENVKELQYLPLFIRPNRLSIVKTSPVTIEATTNGAPSAAMIPLQRDQDYSIFYPAMFFNLQSSRDVTSTTSASASKVNLEEIKLCLQLIKILYAEVEKVFQHQHPEDYQRIMMLIQSPDTPTTERRQQEMLLQEKISTLMGSIGIITPYSEQLNELEREFYSQGILRRRAIHNNSTAGVKKRFSKYQKLQIELNTIDGFQGKEKDIIILTTVRANEEKKIGFLSDIRRLNVAITRAKYGLFIIGKTDTLVSNRYWKYLINHLSTQQALINVPNSQVSLRRLLVQHQQKYGNYPINGIPSSETVNRENNESPPPPAPPSPVEVNEDKWVHSSDYYPPNDTFENNDSSVVGNPVQYDESVERTHHPTKKVFISQNHISLDPNRGSLPSDFSSYSLQKTDYQQSFPSQSHSVDPWNNQSFTTRECKDTQPGIAGQKRKSSAAFYPDNGLPNQFQQSRYHDYDKRPRRQPPSTELLPKPRRTPTPDEMEEGEIFEL